MSNIFLKQKSNFWSFCSFNSVFMAIFFPSFIHCCEWVWNDTLCSNFIAFFWNHISSGFYPLFSASESQSVENKLVYLLKLFDYSSIFSCWRVVFLFELINCSENSLLKPDRVGISGYTKISYLNRQLIIPPTCSLSSMSTHDLSTTSFTSSWTLFAWR